MNSNLFIVLLIHESANLTHSCQEDYLPNIDPTRKITSMSSLQPQDISWRDDALCLSEHLFPSWILWGDFVVFYIFFNTNATAMSKYICNYVKEGEIVMWQEQNIPKMRYHIIRREWVKDYICYSCFYLTPTAMVQLFYCLNIYSRSNCLVSMLLVHGKLHQGDNIKLEEGPVLKEKENSMSEAQGYEISEPWPRKSQTEWLKLLLKLMVSLQPITCTWEN